MALGNATSSSDSKWHTEGHSLVFRVGELRGETTKTQKSY